MNPPEEQLLRDAAGDATPRLTVRADTRVDTGRWGRRSPLWLCVMRDELILLSVGRRRYLQRVGIDDCRDSHYNAACGGLVISPAEGLRFPCVEMPASEALRALDFIHSTTETTHRC